MRGLRIRPWLHELARRQPESAAQYRDCTKCMSKRDEQARQLMGCGYAPPPVEKLRPHVESSVWDGSSLGRERQPDELDEKRRVRLPVCAGYVCSLPEVLEASWAHEYWKNGELGQFCDGQSTEQMREAIHVLAIEQAAVAEWSSANPVKK